MQRNLQIMHVFIYNTENIKKLHTTNVCKSSVALNIKNGEVNPYAPNTATIHLGKEFRRY